MPLTSPQSDRAAGVLLGQACGDALGVPYELGSRRLGPADEPKMLGGGLGGYAPGEWSDNTQMAICIAEVSATGAAIDSPEALDLIAQRFMEWLDTGPADIGVQTRTVLALARRRHESGHRAILRASRELHEESGRTAGNGALMRTGIVGLSQLHDRDATAAAARALSELTHWDPLAGDSCVLWVEAIRRAVIDGVLDLSSGVDLVPSERRDSWATAILAAEQSDPRAFRRNGYTVTALQAAWSAITHTDRHDGDPAHVVRALHAAIRIGGDTDTVAAIAGALLGARYGASAIPFHLRRRLHGWPGLRARDLTALAAATARGGLSPNRWPWVATMDTGHERALAAPLPADPEVLLGTTADLRRLRDLRVSAVVTLCRLGSEEYATHVSADDHAEFWLIDSDRPAENQHLDFVLDDAARAVQTFRQEGKRVLLHCVAAQHRTPAVALRYCRRLGLDAEVAARDITTCLGVPGIDGLLWERAHA